MKRLSILLFIFLALVFTGCVRYNEALSLNRNGTGQITFRMGIMELPPMFADLDDEDDVFVEEEDEEVDLNEFPGITLVESKQYVQDGIDWTEVTLEFESLNDLAAVLSGEEFVPVGQISFTEQGRNMIYERKLAPLVQYREDGMDFDTQMITMFFGEYHWVYELSLPGRIVDSNAKPENIDPQTNTVKWELSFTELLDDGTEMWVEIAL